MHKPRFFTRALVCFALAASAPTVFVGCSDDEGPATGTDVEALDVDSQAASLRTSLNNMLFAHQIYAAKATGAALGGRDDEFAAYGKLLNENGLQLGNTVGSVYGEAAKNSFNTIWSAHNGFFVDYTVGVAKKDKAMQDKAVDDLLNQYVPQFADLISGATGLPRDAVAELTTDHVVHTKEIVDAQASGNPQQAAAKTRTAVTHIQSIGDALASAIADQNDIPGSTSGKGPDLRVALNRLLIEHMYVATSATGAALGGREGEFAAYGALLNENGTDLGAAVGSVYGEGAKNEFNRIWSAHNGFFVDYTVGVAKKDSAMQAKAVENLTTLYVPEFSALIAGATGLPQQAVADLTVTHVLQTKAVVDKQAAGDASGAAEADRLSIEHMHMIGDPLASSIVASKPDLF